MSISTEIAHTLPLPSRLHPRLRRRPDRPLRPDGRPLLLGRTQTVIYAGMAEICAGSISMGIGGYLAAKGEQAASTAAASKSGGGVAVDDDEMGGDEEKEAALGNADDDVVEEYLAPLNLRGDLRAAVEAHVRGLPGLVDVLRTKARDDHDDTDTEAGYGDRASSPIMVGLSVSIGYLLGGLLPLFPYFFVHQVGDGLRWSFGVCLLALFLFGFTKHYLLQDDDDAQRPRRHQRRRRSAQWKRVRASLWEGTQMVVLGSIAAVTAVLAVQALEGLASRD
ncbi:hypothetical protein PG985_016116 [Apiospora marii]|uniref:Uncharacterized protein n=1 Tax=Apiospora marii TaxID=335849 RepID=A0ABR1S3M1_9PEZI